MCRLLTSVFWLSWSEISPSTASGRRLELGKNGDGWERQNTVGVRLVLCTSCSPCRPLAGSWWCCWTCHGRLWCVTRRAGARGGLGPGRGSGAQTVGAEQQGLEERQLCLPGCVRRLACTVLSQGSLWPPCARPAAGTATSPIQPVCGRDQPAYSQLPRSNLWI